MSARESRPIKARGMSQDALSRTLVNDPKAAGRDLLHLVRRVSKYRPAAPGPPPAYAEIRQATEARRKDGAA